MDVYVLKRPFVDHFLRTVGHRFEVRARGRGPVRHRVLDMQRELAAGPQLLNRQKLRLHPAECDPISLSLLWMLQVVVFTASLGKYADPLLDLLDKANVVRWRLFREACCPYEGSYVKVRARCCCRGATSS